MNDWYCTDLCDHASSIYQCEQSAQSDLQTVEADQINWLQAWRIAAQKTADLQVELVDLERARAEIRSNYVDLLELCDELVGALSEHESLVDCVNCQDALARSDSMRRS